MGAAPADLRDVDWANVSIPGDFCSVPGVVRLREGGAEASSDVWGTVQVDSHEETEYGDINGDSQEEAVVHVSCDNGGGTASGRLASAAVVLTRTRGRLTVLGTVTPQKNPQQAGPTRLHAQAKPGRVVSLEFWYRPADATCCPSGKATTIWRLRGGELVPGAPHITS